jgi:hypothetical protein
MSSAPIVAGQYITLWSSMFNRFVRINNDQCDRSSEMSRYDLPARNVWTWERFIVVDGGVDSNGYQTYAFWNPTWKRYVRMNHENMDGSGTKDNANDLPDSWTWERFVVVNTGSDINGHQTIALWNPQHKRYMRMRPDSSVSDGMDGSGTRDAPTPFPESWTWEKFTVIEG